MMLKQQSWSFLSNQRSRAPSFVQEFNEMETTLPLNSFFVPEGFSQIQLDERS